MGIYDKTVEVPVKTMVLFFVVDTSASMEGTKIGTLNSAIAEIQSDLKSISEDNADAKIKVATLAFSTGASWMESEPVAAENFRWNYLEAHGVTDLGAACKMLNEKLSRKEGGYMNEVVGSFAPVIFLLSDGYPTDDYKKGLEILKKNTWFQAATKMALAIGEEADMGVLAEFTGKSESVVTANRTGELKRWIRFLTVTSSQIGTQSTVVGYGGDPGKNDQESRSDGEPESKQKQLIEKIQEEKKRMEEEEDGAYGEYGEYGENFEGAEYKMKDVGDIF